MNKIINDEYSKVPDHYSRSMHQLINALLNKDPYSRPSISNIIQLPEIVGEVNTLSFSLSVFITDFDRSSY